MAAIVPPGTEVLAGLEMGGIAVVTMLSQVTGLPSAFIRKKRKDYGTCRYAEGATLTGRHFMLVEDVVTTGGAILDAVSLLEADGLRPEGALCVIDRSRGDSERTRQSVTTSAASVAKTPLCLVSKTKAKRVPRPSKCRGLRPRAP
jgi:orotate phosphoribosyltransferase